MIMYFHLGRFLTLIGIFTLYLASCLLLDIRASMIMYLFACCKRSTKVARVFLVIDHETRRVEELVWRFEQQLTGAHWSLNWTPVVVFLYLSFFLFFWSPFLSIYMQYLYYDEVLCWCVISSITDHQSVNSWWLLSNNDLKWALVGC